MNTLQERLKFARNQKGMSQSQLGKAIGKSQSAIAALESGRNKESTNIILLAQVLGVSAIWLATGQGEMLSEAEQSNVSEHGEFVFWDRFSDLPKEEWVLIPFYRDTKVSAGNGIEQQKDSNNFRLPFSRTALRRLNIDSKNAVCMNVVGNSMLPILPENSTVGINMADREIRDGQIYAIKYNGLLRVKFLYLISADTVRIRSANSAEFADEEITLSDMEIIGRVFWWSVLV